VSLETSSFCEQIKNILSNSLSSWSLFSKTASKRPDVDFTSKLSVLEKMYLVRMFAFAAKYDYHLNIADREIKVKAT